MSFDKRGRVRCSLHLSPAVFALIDRMQGELLVRTGTRVEKSELADAAILYYCGQRFPQLSAGVLVQGSTDKM